MLFFTLLYILPTRSVLFHDQSGLVQSRGEEETACHQGDKDEK